MGTGYHTFNELFKVFSWSMAALRAGRCWDKRHDGSELTSWDKRHRMVGALRITAALVQIRGDWEWLAQCFRFRHFGSDWFCFLCDATHTGPLSFYNMNDDAPYLPTVISHEMYLLDCTRNMTSPSSIFDSPGFRFEWVSVDSMHAGDLGPHGDFIGGVMYVEISQRSLHPNFAAGVKWINEQLECYYAANPGLSQMHLTLNMVKPADGFPTLKSKAAECRHLARFALFLAQRHARLQLEFSEERLRPQSARYREKVVVTAQALVDYCDSCSADVFSPDCCKTAMTTLLKGLVALRLLFRTGLDSATAQGKQPFGLRPKAHMLMHLVNHKLLLWGSPRMSWCYADEDFVGLIKNIAMCTRHPRTIEKRLLAKYRLYAALYAHSLGAALIG